MGDSTLPKVGLITYDEVIYAGGYYNKSNSSYYLYNGTYTVWTMSPSGLSSTYASVSSGKLVAGTTTSSPFKILGQHNVDIGGTSVPTWVLMKVA